MILSAALFCAGMAGCGESGAEVKVTEDLESMRYVELDEKVGEEINSMLSDQGKEFDPTQKEDANPNINPIDRDLGGMGIYIVKNIMNKVTYQRLEGRNLLTMKKEIKQ